MAHVFRCSPYPGTSAEHATLLAVADTVSDVNGNQLWMGQTELAKKARITPRRLRDALKRLRADGWLISVREATYREPAVVELVLEGHDTVWEPRSRRDKRARGDAASGGDAASAGDRPSGGDAESGPDGASGGEGTERPPRGDAASAEPKGTQQHPNGSATPPSAATGRGPIVDVTVDGETLQVDASDPDPSFAAWWGAYPRHPATGNLGGGGSRKVSLTRWRRLSTPKRAAALAAIGHYHDHLAATGHPPVYAEKWLAQERWQDFASPPATGSAGLNELARAIATTCHIDVDELTGPGRAELVTCARVLAPHVTDLGQVGGVAREADREWGGRITITPAVLVKHWHRFVGRARTGSGGATSGATSVCPRCRQPQDDRHTAASCAEIVELLEGVT